MARAKGGQLNAERLRELARAGAEQAVKQLRAEIVAIERTFPELALSKRRRALRRSIDQSGPADDADVRRGAQGGFGPDEAVLGGAPEGASEDQIAPVKLLSHVRPFDAHPEPVEG